MNRIFKTALISACVLTMAGCSSTASSSTSKPAASSTEQTDNTVVEVTGGKVKGYVDDNGVRTFKGIPYAASTAGENRFKDPQPVESWDDVKECTEFGPIVVQNEPVPFMMWTKEYVDNDCTLENGRMGEDSLNLNVWTTAEEGAKEPVIVYIHGGGNTSGSGENEVYTGQNIAQKGVVYLTINYRVGLYGFLCYKDGTGEEITGNFATKDQIAALKWVQDNIEKFGGDPNNVTIAGQSAGSANVQTLIASPAAKGLFKHAVAMSANSYGFGPMSGVKTMEDAEKEASEALGDVTVEQLRSMPVEDLEKIRANYNPSSTVNDGEYVTQDLKTAYNSGNFNHVDLMQGGVTGDTTLFGGFITLPDDDNNPQTPVTSISPADFKAAVQTQLGDLTDEFLAAYPVDDSAENVISVNNDASFDNAVAQYSITLRAKDSGDSENKSYQYMFTHPVPDKDKSLQESYGAFHTGDVGYWLNYFSTSSDRPWEDADYKLGDTMSSYLVNFAKTGDPNGDSLSKWDSGASTGFSYMKLDEDNSMTSFDDAKTKFWTDYYANN